MSFTPQQAAQALVNLIVSQDGRPGRTYGFVVTGNPLAIAGFPGALQAAFLNAGYAVSDLAAGLSYAVTEGWMTAGQTLNGVLQQYTLTAAGFTAGGGTAPTISAAAQQLVNVAAAINNSPGAALFNLRLMVPQFAVVVGSNNFQPEDMVPALGQALADGYVLPAGRDLFEPIFILTAAGVAAAS